MCRSLRVAAAGCLVALITGCAAPAHVRPAGVRPPAPAPSQSSVPHPVPAARARAAVARVVRTITIGSAVGSPDGMASGAGSLWVGGYGGSSIVQIDPATDHLVRTIGVGASPLGVAVIGGSVWVADYQGSQVSRINPATGKVTATVGVGQAPDSFAVIGQRLWVFDQGQQAASVLNQARRKVQRTVPLTVQSGFASAGAGRVWIPDLEGATRTVIGLDAATGRVRTTVRTAPHPSEVAFAFGSGWVTCEGAVIRFSPRTGAVQATIRDAAAGFDGIAADDGAIWVADSNGGVVDRISPATSKITGSVRVGSGPRHIIAISGDLWVDNFADGTLMRLHPGR
jgi:YVTN family beta-propeller protein